MKIMITHWHCQKLITSVLVSLLVTNSVHSTVNISGDQSGIWTKANSPYMLTGTVTVPAGETLTIQPGVTVVFTSPAVSLIVNGKLNAQGSSADSIRFKGQATSDHANLYGGALNINGAGTIIRYLNIDSLGQSNWVTGSIIIADTLTPVITNSAIRHSGNADIFCWLGAARNMSGIIGNISVPGANVIIDALMPKFSNSSHYNLFGTQIVAEGKTLTIQPGVKVVFTSPAVSLIVNGKLNAQGSSADSIRFKGQATSDHANLYGGALNINGAGTIIRYLNIDSLGQSNWVTGSIIIADTLTPVITNSAIRHSGNADIFCWLGAARNMSGIIGNISVPGANVIIDALMPKFSNSSHYNLFGTQIVAEGKMLTIQPGVKVVFTSPAVSLIVNGKLNAQGSSADSIRFKGQATSDHANFYGGALNINGAGTIIRYLNIDSLGQSNWVTGSIIIADTLTPVITNSAIRHSGNADIFCWLGAARNMSGIIGNISVPGANVIIDALMPKFSISSHYNLLGAQTVAAGKTLTIKPGVKVVFSSPNSDLIINGSLSARGSIHDTIQFSGPADNINHTLYGGSVYLNADGSSLDFISIDSLGGNSARALVLSAGCDVKYASIRNSNGTGISIYSPKANISYSDIFKNNTGIAVYNVKAVINNCNIFNNTNYGVNNVTLTYLTDATSCYWGKSSGPYHPTLNPAGTGNKVSDSVKFSPWKTSMIKPTLPFIAGFSPVGGATDSVINITGLRFTGTTNVSFGGIAAQSFVVQNDSTIRAIVSSGSSGYIKVTTSKGSDSLAGFIYCSSVILHAGFTAETSFFNVNIVNTSSNATSYLWDFGDAINSNAVSPAHYYVSAGTYNLCLTATNICARKSETVCKIVTIDGVTFTDADKDGLYDLTEPALYGTRTGNFDTNNDGLGDGTNVFTGLSALSADTDGDGISNLQEILNGTNPVLPDTDFDGVPDNLDPFPLDRFRTKLPPKNSSDHTAPSIIIAEPF